MTPTSTLPDWLARAIASLQRGDIDGWMEIYSPEAVHEFPFAPEGAPRRVEGRDAIAAYMHAVFETVRFGPLSDVRVREAGDETVVEATAHHRRLSDDVPHEVGFVWIITRQGGRVTHYRDYMNAQQLNSL